ncbi:MAG: hypothetical protein LC808_31275, partial [Actinobacteria bacterium]|nr:hypothetical protein [Actinomycetota bacterium]
MTQQTLRTKQTRAVSAGGAFWRSRTIWLWLLVIFVGIQFGAGLYEKLAVVPLWADVPASQVLDQMKDSGMW